MLGTWRQVHCRLLVRMVDSGACMALPYSLGLAAVSTSAAFLDGRPRILYNITVEHVLMLVYHMRRRS